jgi:hypothetical protein
MTIMTKPRADRPGLFVDDGMGRSERGFPPYPSRASSTALIEMRDQAAVRSRNAM